MRRDHRVALWLCVLLAATIAPWALAQTDSGNGLTAVPGRPWTSIIPDPDQYDWGKVDRPGYRFRGMLPAHKRFYDYIQAKRAAGQELSAAEDAIIRTLTMIRRWPEPPHPNQFWAAFMRYLRNLQTSELNTAQSLMLADLVFRGLVVFDAEPNEDVKRLVEYLKQPQFEPRNWFERNFIKVETWMNHYIAANSYDMHTAVAPGNVFPGEPFNGMQITYNLTGATITEKTDSFDFQTSRNMKGYLQQGGTLTLSGSVRVGGYGADVTVAVSAGAKQDEKKFYVKNEGEGGNPTSFSVSVPIEKGTEAGSFSVKMDGRYSMGGGWRGLSVGGSLEKSPSDKAADQVAADAEWRRKVEDTLQQLGYEDTPEGRKVKEMREALKGGDAGWKAYVDRNLKELGYSSDEVAQEYAGLKQALEQDGKPWADWSTAHGVPVSDPSQGDTGSLQVGTSASNGQPADPAAHFAEAPEVATGYTYRDLPANTNMVATWTRDGQEVAHSERQVGGSGWVAFTLKSGDTGGLEPGDYRVVLTANGQTVGSKFFTIGRFGSTAEAPWWTKGGRSERPAVGGGIGGRSTPGAEPTDKKSAETHTLSSKSSSVRAPLTVDPKGGKIAFQINYRQGGVVLDTVGINRADPGDFSMAIGADGSVVWQVFHPDIAGPKRNANGWHVLVSSVKLQPGKWQTVAVTAGARGLNILINGNVVAKCDTVLSLTTKPVYLGDFPGDDQWGEKYNIHPAFIGEIKGLTWLP